MPANTGLIVQPQGTTALIPPQATNPASSGQRFVPFRVATTERTNILISDAGTITGNEQVIDRVLEGTGYIYSISLHLTITTAGNAAAVAFAEDGPFNALSSVVFRDPSAEELNLDGFSLYLANLSMRNYANFGLDSTMNIVDTTDEYFSAVTGAGATGGSVLLNEEVPLGINRRNLLGLLGNQDRGVRYQLRDNINSTGQIYSTAPTNPGAFTLERIYESYAVPSPVGAYGPQQWTPDGFGTIHWLTKNVSEAVPAANVTLNHFVRRLGNMWRFVVLVIRANTRALGQTSVSTISLKMGDTDFYNEPYWFRRQLMAKRYGFRFPSGVLVYEMMHDFLPFAGGELGDDWINTKDVNTGQFTLTYNGNVQAGGSLTFITDDLAMVGQPIGS